MDKLASKELRNRGWQGLMWTIWGQLDLIWTVHGQASKELRNKQTSKQRVVGPKATQFDLNHPRSTGFDLDCKRASKQRAEEQAKNWGTSKVGRRETWGTVPMKRLLFKYKPWTPARKAGMFPWSRLKLRSTSWMVTSCPSELRGNVMGRGPESWFLLSNK